MPGYFIQPFHSAPKVPFNFDGHILFRSEKYDLIHLSLEPGEGMELHAQPMDVVFFVLEGEGTLNVDNEIIKASANTTVQVQAGVERGWKNTGTTPLRLLVNKIH